MPIFSIPNNGVIWVLILEKAWAKLHGTYKKSVSGSASEAFRDILGAPSYVYFVKGNQDLFMKLLVGSIEEFMMAASCKPENNKKLENGLMYNHTYGILDVFELENKG